MGKKKKKKKVRNGEKKKKNQMISDLSVEVVIYVQVSGFELVLQTHPSLYRQTPMI